MAHVRAALYLDFDNVFSGLFKLDPEVADRFASDPGSWLKRLSGTALTGEFPRRWLVLRCYLNPGGWVPNPDPVSEQPRLYFSRYRSSFVRAGFEVIDCPRYSATKNGADIRIVVDAVDALAADTVYEEFVVASGDSDMTPLLQRLRRADRRTMIVSPADAVEAYTAIADQVLDGQNLLALVQGEPVDLDDVDDPAHIGLVHNRVEGADVVPFDLETVYESFRSIVTTEYSNASIPLNKAALGIRLRDELGPVVGATNWFGSGSFTRAVESLKLPNLRMSEHLLWDESRHTTPEVGGSASQRLELPEPVERVTEQINLPRLTPDIWRAIYQALSEYAHSHRFNMTQCTSWARDRLREQDIPVSRSAVGFVVRGASFGGYPLYHDPAPTSEEIGKAFVDNVLGRAEAAEVGLTEEEGKIVRNWLGEEVDPHEDEPSAADQEL